MSYTWHHYPIVSWQCASVFLLIELLIESSFSICSHIVIIDCHRISQALYMTQYYFMEETHWCAHLETDVVITWKQFQQRFVHHSNMYNTRCSLRHDETFITMFNCRLRWWFKAVRASFGGSKRNSVSWRPKPWAPFLECDSSNSPVGRLLVHI